MNSPNKRQHINVDELQQRLTVHQIAQFYGFPLPDSFGNQGEQRMSCPCKACEGSQDERSVGINVSDPFKRWKCHRESYGCGAMGNAISLAYCMKHGQMPPGGKATGREFYAIAQDLQAMDNSELSAAVPSPAVGGVQDATKGEVALKLQPNVPLAESENEGARKLGQLDQQFVRDPAELSAAASAYARRHPVLLAADVAAETRHGYIPSNAKSTLRGQWAYGVCDASGQALAWIGRNVKYEQEIEKFRQAGGRGQEPLKYRFPKQVLFRRGLELYGQEFVRDERFAESLGKHGIILVEGFNDRLRLHELGILSLGIMINQMTEHQVSKVARLARDVGDNRVGLMFDLDEKGQEGAKESLWRLHEQGVHGYLLWTRENLGSVVAHGEPERLSDSEWSHLLAQS